MDRAISFPTTVYARCIMHLNMWIFQFFETQFLMLELKMLSYNCTYWWRKWLLFLPLWRRNDNETFVYFPTDRAGVLISAEAGPLSAASPVYLLYLLLTLLTFTLSNNIKNKVSQLLNTGCQYVLCLVW